MTNAHRFPHLFTPYSIKGVEYRNRVAISGHYAGWWVGPGGLPSDAFAAYIAERCKDNGVGLFVIGATNPEPGSWLQNVDDRIIPRYKMLADAAHRHGAKIHAQLCHPGFKPLPGIQIIEEGPVSPSIKPSTQRPRVIPSIDRLHELINAFGKAAGRAAAGGVDGVEVHSHESFLHAEMLNPYWNQRTDAYGGSLENRMRFLVETLQAMRAAIGPNMPLGVRLKIDDIVQRGMGPEEYRECVRRLEAAKLVDYVIFTGGDGRFHHGPMPRPDGEFLPLVREMRKATKLPMLHAGRITTPAMADKAIADGLLDMVCMTKTHICDPHFTSKVFHDRLEDVRYCTRCLQACHGHMGTMSCVYNPVTRREIDGYGTLQPAATRKRVVIVGAGPAGMEAAITAAGRGHTVIVLEKTHQVGGQVRVGGGSPLRRNWLRIADFYERQVKKGEFEVRYGVEADANAVLMLHPEVVIIATGSQPVRYSIPGGKTALTVHEVIAGQADRAKGVLIYDREGFNRPMVAADYLSSRGIHVEFVSPLDRIGPKIESMMLDEFVHRLKARGVVFHPGEELLAWDGATAQLKESWTGREYTLEGVDAICGAVGSTSVNGLAAQLKPYADVHVIGDALEPRTVEDATSEAGRLAREI